jgi:hypothetical protein
MIKNTILAALALGALGLGACDSKSELEKCVNEHVAEKLTETDALAECLSDELAKKFMSQSECEEFVLNNGGYENTRAAACMKYFEEAPPAGDAGTGN